MGYAIYGGAAQDRAKSGRMHTDRDSRLGETGCFDSCSHIARTSGVASAVVVSGVVASVTIPYFGADSEDAVHGRQCTREKPARHDTKDLRQRPQRS